VMGSRAVPDRACLSGKADDCLCASADELRHSHMNRGLTVGLIPATLATFPGGIEAEDGSAQVVYTPVEHARPILCRSSTDGRAAH
jgi:hypothetical protein